MKKTALISIFGLCLLASVANAQTPEGKAAKFKVGKLELISLNDTGFNIPNDAKVFGMDAGVEAVTKVLKDANAPTDQVPLSVDALLVRDGARLILIDTGTGQKSGGKLLASLKTAGIAPESITDILITHAHFDHVGGLVTADGKPAFVNATVRMTANEWAWMQAREGSIETAKIIASQVKTFEPNAKISDHVTAVAVDGHTPGHTAYEVKSGRHRLMDIGDSAHSSIVSLAHPEWTIQWDDNKPLATQSRVTLLNRLAKSGESVFSPHFPYPGVGKVVATGKGANRKLVWKATL